MKTLFIAAESRKSAALAMPWAAKIIKVDGGYMGFASIADYKTWQAQR